MTSPTVRVLGVPASSRVAGVHADDLPVWSTTQYRDPVRSAVVAWKDRGRADLTPYLAQALRRAAGRALPSGPVLLVPAPSSRRARRERGHDPVRDVAVRCAASLRRAGADVRVVPALVHARRVADQAGLGSAARADNLDGALAVSRAWVRHVVGRECVVVDDVVTTGATLLESTRALRAAGAAGSGAATVAATPRRDGPPPGGSRDR
jgi:predicted amidophosphoribosyltransferase